jgi:PhzF family phenazine biosynthesis protein
MGIPVFQVDAFTDRPFAGNPAAVCLLPEAQPDRWMQQVAQEMNLSETAFLTPQADGFGLRWFTPSVEVDLCGHATLASAHVLWHEGVLVGNQPVQFHTRSGVLTATQQGNWIELDFPLTPCTEIALPPELATALQLSPSSIRFVGKTMFDYFVEVESAAIVQQLQPNFPALRELPMRGVIVTSGVGSSIPNTVDSTDSPPSREPAYDFISRFFAPRAGIDEDPVTGSAHCALAPFWGDRLGKSALIGYQASVRGGSVRVQVCGDRVLLAGQCITVLRGELC